MIDSFEKIARVGGQVEDVSVTAVRKAWKRPEVIVGTMDEAEAAGAQAADDTPVNS